MQRLPTSKKPKQQAKKLAPILMAIMLAACETNTPAQTNDYCAIYKPIHDHAKDTFTTRAQVLDRNATYECVCLDNCPR